MKVQVAYIKTVGLFLVVEVLFLLVVFLLFPHSTDRGRPPLCLTINTRTITAVQLLLQTHTHTVSRSGGV